MPEDLLSCFLVGDGAGGLVGGHYEDFGDLHVLGGAGCEPCHFGDVGSGQGADALVDAVGLCLVTAEAHDGEIGLHEAGLDVGDSQRSVR